MASNKAHSSSSLSQPPRRIPVTTQTRLSQEQKTIIGALNIIRPDPSAAKKRSLEEPKADEHNSIGALVNLIAPKIHPYIIHEIKQAIKPLLEANIDLKIQIERLKQEIETVTPVVEENRILKIQLEEMKTEIELLKLTRDVTMTEPPEENLSTQVAEMRSYIEALKSNNTETGIVEPVVNTEITQELRRLRDEMTETKQSTMQSKAREERQEQYTRRESIRLFNITEHPNERTDEIVVRACQAMGVNITRGHISVSHRVGSSRHNDRRPIICKFVSRNTKYAVMENRANLRWNPQWSRVRVYEDLTPQRSRIIRTLTEKNERFSTMDGRIEIRKGANKIVIDDLMDLETKLGWNRENILDLFVYKRPVNQQSSRN